MDNPETSVQEATTPELMAARTCQISGSQRKAEVLKLHKILRKQPTVQDLPGKNGPKSLILFRIRNMCGHVFITLLVRVGRLNRGSIFAIKHLNNCNVYKIFC
jgi:hypothetical protein